MFFMVIGLWVNPVNLPGALDDAGSKTVRASVFRESRIRLRKTSSISETTSIIANIKNFQSQ